MAEEKLLPERLKGSADGLLAGAKGDSETYDALRLGRDMKPELMCATINDSMRMGEKKRTIFRRIHRQDPREPGERPRNAQGRTGGWGYEYVEIANKALSLLAMFPLTVRSPGRLSGHVHCGLGGGDVICDAIPATLADIFPSLEEWLVLYFWARWLEPVENVSEFLSRRVSAQLWRSG